MFQERIIDELDTEMDSTKNRLEFVQVKPLQVLLLYFEVSVKKVESERMKIGFVTEKSGNGNEESWSKRSNDDDMFLARLVHHPFRSRLLDLE